jgi:hypothetical protein
VLGEKPDNGTISTCRLQQSVLARSNNQYLPALTCNSTQLTAHTVTPSRQQTLCTLLKSSIPCSLFSNPPPVSGAVCVCRRWRAFFTLSSFLVCELICFVRVTYRASCFVQDDRHSSTNVVNTPLIFTYH